MVLTKYPLLTFSWGGGFQADFFRALTFPFWFKNTKMLVTYYIHIWNVLPQNSYLG